MGTTRKLLVVAGAAAVAVGVVAASSIADDPTGKAAQMAEELHAEVALAQSSYADLNRVPVMPAEPVVEVAEGQIITIGRIGGLERVTATMNGADLSVNTTDEAFIVEVGPLRGAGFATLFLHERFDSGHTVTVPYTVVAATSTTPAMEKSPSVAVTPTWTRSIPYGEGVDQLGVEVADEGMAAVPAAFVGLGDGRLAVLDTVKGRVVTVGTEGTVRPLVQLPSQSYLEFAADRNRNSVLAVDPIAGNTVDLKTGALQQLPDFVATLPLGIDFALDDSGAFFARNPGDGVLYSIADPQGRIAASNTERLIDRGRAVALEDRVLIQAALDATPVALDFSDTAWVDVLDTVHLDDGRIVVLTASPTGDQLQFELHVTDASGSTVAVPVDFDPRFAINNSLAVADGSTVVVGYPTAKSFEFAAYKL